MNLTLVDPATLDLLSRMTSRPLQFKDINPLLLFLAGLICVLRGVMVIDRTVEDAEEDRLQSTLSTFLPLDESMRQLTQVMIQQVEFHQIYIDPQEFLRLTAPLSEAERLLLLSLGYEMSAADGTIDLREKLYLNAIANRLGIAPRYLNVLEAGFSQGGTMDAAALTEVRDLLAPHQFVAVDPVFVQAATDMLTILNRTSAGA